MCNHNKLTLAEHCGYESKTDLATKLVFICSECGPKVSFMSSPMSRIHPENYTINKKLLPMLGPVAYYKVICTIDLTSYMLRSFLQNCFYHFAELHPLLKDLCTEFSYIFWHFPLDASWYHTKSHEVDILNRLRSQRKITTVLLLFDRILAFNSTKN